MVTTYIMKEGRITQNILVGKSKGRRLLTKNGREWEDNIKIGLRETVYEDAVGSRQLDTIWPVRTLARAW
jgi:hypothetical protein